MSSSAASTPTAGSTPADWGLATADSVALSDRPRWVARLDDGVEVFMADAARCWPALRAFCHATGRRPATFRLQHRSHSVPLPPAPGYYFGRAIAATPGGEQAHLFVAGHVAPSPGGPVVLARHHRLPDLAAGPPTSRPLDIDDPMLILPPTRSPV